MDLDLKNKIFFVSGSSGGIGLGIARSLLEEGSKVILNGRKKEKLIQVKNNLSKEYKEKISTVLGDINHRKTIEMVSEVASKKWGQLDGLVANVGGVKKVHGWDIEQDEWDWFVENNFSVAYNTIQPLIPLIKKSHGSIIIIGSIAGMEELGAPIPYSCSKAALMAYAKSLSFRLAKKKIRVNMISPGNIIFPDGNWDLKQKSNADEVKNMLIEKVPMQRFGKPDDIGSVVAFLLSSKARFITGANIVVDGGQTISLN